MNDTVIELNEANFKREVLEANNLVLVHFWSRWSHSSRAMAPALEALGYDQAGTVKIATVNVEDHEDLTRQWGVRAVPTLLIFSQGSVRDQVVGPATEFEMREKLELVK